MSVATFNFEFSAEELAELAPHANYAYSNCCEVKVDHIDINDYDNTITLTPGNDHGTHEVDATPESAEDFEALSSRYEGDEITGYRLDKAIYSLDPEDGEVEINV